MHRGEMITSFKSCRTDHIMTKAKIYIPTKNSMQSGLGKTDKWVIKFETENTGINPLMGWETSSNTLSELNLEFSSKELAIVLKVCEGFYLISPDWAHFQELF